MLKNSSPQTNPKGPEVQGKKPTPPALPYTLGDAGRDFSRYTLRSPNKYLPAWATGALPRTLLTAGALGLAGRYAAPSILKKMIPGAANNPNFSHRAGRVGIVGGALLALLMNSPDLYSSFQAARGKNQKGQRGHWSQGLKGIINGLGGIPSGDKINPNPIWNEWGKGGKSSSVKAASFWDSSIIDSGAMSNATRQALYDGRIDPTAMLQSSAAINLAGKDSRGRMSPASLGSAAAKMALKGGVGAGIGLAAGKVIGALGGTFGLMTPSSRNITETATALAGAAANILTGTSSFK